MSMLILLLLVHSVSSQDFFWVVTDLHYDPTYDTTQGSCNQHIPPEELGRLGNYECDAPWKLVDSTLTAMRSLHGSPKFIIWMGDTPPHLINDSLTTDAVLTMVHNVTDLIVDNFPGIPVYPVIGNHDYRPTSQLPSVTNDVYDGLAALWLNRSWMDQAAADTFTRAGFYVKAMPELTVDVRAIVLNTNLYKKTNAATDGEDDPAGQFSWLEEQLRTAREAGAKVHVVAHIPPGPSEQPGSPVWLRAEQSARLHDILRRHTDVIIAVYTGHQHHDTFKIIKNNEGHPGAPLFVIPSVTPWKARIAEGVFGAPRNPAVRRYTYQSSAPATLIDYDQYYLDLPRANEDPSTAWQRLYNFRAAYGQSEVTAEALEHVTDDFREYSSQKFHNYYDYNSVNARDDSYTACSCQCKFNHICAMEEIDIEEFETCVAAVTCRAATLPLTTWVVLTAAVVGSKVLLV